MLESSNNKRVKFIKKGDQEKFILLIKDSTGFPYLELAKISKVGARQFREWRREKSTISLYAFKTLCEIAGISEPKNIEIIDAYEHTSRAGKLGGIKVFEKYKKLPFSEEQRLEGWKKWWATTGKLNLNPILIRKEVTFPKKSSELAEICGILIGDGGITKYQINITLNSETDKLYSKFVVKLINNLFNIEPKIYRIRDSKAINITISRSNLVDFLVSIGLKMGHKINQKVSIPDWIINSKKFKISCLRGMVDTDGCVVHETHKIKGKKYVYPRINFTSACPSLIQQVVLILTELGFNPKVRSGGRSVQLENLKEVCQYFNVVGTNNPKHLERISSWY